MLTIGTIVYVALLLINAMAVLSEERFLARISMFDTTSLREMVLMYTCTQVPLIGLNLVVIVYELILGG
ncbi:hypothetical protein ID866_8523 [Astraeus odoratus]|nr:hypothetical protein ID866_8523 [Astraeus odoratus]